MNHARACACGARRQSSFPRLSSASRTTRMAAGASLPTWSWLMTSTSVGAGVLMVREITHARIERTGARDAKNAHLGPLAKRAGARCAF